MDLQNKLSIAVIFICLVLFILTLYSYINFRKLYIPDTKYCQVKVNKDIILDLNKKGSVSDSINNVRNIVLSFNVNAMERTPILCFQISNDNENWVNDSNSSFIVKRGENSQEYSVPGGYYCRLHTLIEGEKVVSDIINVRNNDTIDQQQYRDSLNIKYIILLTSIPLLMVSLGVLQYKDFKWASIRQLDNNNNNNVD